MDEPIAVIGLDARFPGDGDTAERFYEFLLAGRSAHTDIPAERYNAEAFYHPDTNRPGTTRVRSGHFLKDSISAFDAPFFSITPAEARSMDPQQRGILESVYKALENAGISLHQAAGSQTGVYVGCMYSDYDRMTVKDIDVPSKYAALGTVYSMLSNRVSWCFDLRGPSMTIDTACSSSLIALHQACNSLKLREANMAIVGGCNLILSQEFPLLLDTAGVLGPDGISYSFDSRGNGYSRGEGFGTVVLKKVSDAIRDGDVIRAVIRNTGSNQDGKSPGITSPTKAAQAELIRQTYARAGLDPSVTRFFEAHGTGTAVGDPIEASAISDVFTQYRSADQPLYIGALKSNIGHTEGAAGVAAIIKGVFTLERGVIPANTWFEKRNPRIQDSWNLAFPTQATEWPQSGLRRMSINSFGVGGTNAHVIMDDALHFLKHHRLLGLHRTLPKNILPISVRGDVSPTLSSSRHQHTDSGVVSDYEPSTDNEDGASAAEVAPMSEAKPRNEHTAAKQKEAAGQVQETVSSTHTESISLPESLFSHPRLFLLSSYDQSGIARLGEQYRQYFAQSPSKKRELSTDAQFLRDLSYTLSHKRTQHGWRSFCLAKSVSDLGASIGEKPATRAAPEPRLAFIFTGQGAQWATMGRELMVYPAFQASLYAADTYLNNIGCSWSLTYELSKDAESSRVNAAEFSQPLCTALQVALVDLLKTWGVKPHAVAGHSSGEIAAAYAAGQISRESAWRISFYRGKLSAQLASDGTQPKTGMAAVGADKPTTLQYIQSINNTISDGALEIACENSPDSFTVSGDMTKIDALVELVKQDNAFARKLNVELAYHSRYMKPMSEDYLRFMGDVKSDSPLSTEDIVFASSLHGRIISPSDLQSPSYWVENLVSPVRFDSAVTALLSRRPSAKMGQPQGISDILEIGPHSALKGPLRSIAAKIPEGDKIRYHSLLLRRESAVDTALEAAGSLWSRGFNVDISEVNQYNMASPDRPVMLTDLPSYAFNHSTEYWAESRISRNARLRSKPRHELLGAPVPDWNEHNATWRNYIRLSENPWIQDHKVAGESLYPAAGMLVMAIEASRQLADQTKVLRGFRFKNVSFHLALRVPKDDLGIESHFYLRPYRDLNENATTEWKEFQLWTCENDVWREHCHGLVQTEYEDSPKDLFSASLLESAQQKIKDRNGQKVSVDKIYKSFARVGLDFGPTFRTLQNARVSSTGDILATVDNKVDLIRSSMPKQYLQPHLVHPSTLDGVIQANLAPLVLAAKASRQTIVPVFARGLWVAASQDLIHDSYIVSSHCESRDEAGAETSFAALQVGSDRLMAYSSGVRFQVLPDASTEEETQPITHSLNLAWKGDPTYLDEEAAAAYFSVPLDDKDHPSRWSVDCDALSLLYMRQFLDATPESSIEKMEWFHKRYVAWMRHIVARTTPKIDDTDISEVEERVRTAGTPEGRLTIAVGQALNGMLLGDLNPLDVVFENKLAENVYRHGVGAQRCYLQMCNYIDSLAHKNPKMRILEVGAGTGGATVPAIKTLTRLGRRFDHYDFTDISPSFFEYAKESFKDQVENMSFRVLNIENKPTEQGFEAGAYDLILAANVLHATKDMDNTLSNVRSLLKPGGKLIIFELTNVDSLLGGFCFGVLSGWWLSVDPDREWGPLMTAESWKKHLQNVGFSGLDAAFNDFPDSADQVSSIMVSGVPNEAQPPSSSPVTYIIADSTSTLQQSVAGQISSAITEQGPIEQVTLDYLREKDLQKAACIMLTELDRPLLKNLTEETLPIMQKVIRDCREVFWVTQGGEDLVPSPDVELVTGFARSIREERPELHVVTVSFGKDVPADGISRSCVKLLQAVRSGETDNTFRVNGSTILVPRLVQADYMTQHMLAQATQSSPSEEALCRFDPDASYVIAGGFGGLGKSTALWMASRGAKNLILLSRSGPRDEAAREFLDDLERVCDRVAAPSCDITDLSALKTTITECLSTMPPIKGCIQGSMILRDNAFTSMTFEEWDTGVRAKVQGSENLHEVLGRDLDFFILLSSTVALTGNPGQSNYGAANTFLDAFARKLVSQGEQAVALNLPVISDIGFVAEKAALLDELLSKGWSHLEEDEVHAVLDWHCRRREEGTPLIYSQVAPRLWLPQDTAFEGAEMPPWASDKLFSHIWPRTITSSASNKEEGRTDVQFSSLLAAVSSLAEAEKIVLDALLLKLSRVLSVELSNLDPAKAMHAYGVDSLVAVGLRAWFAKEVRAELSVFEMNDKPSIYALASTAAERSKLLPALPTNE